MAGGPSQVGDLSSHQTALLKNSVREKILELDQSADESLTEYVMVLLANRHGMEKVMADLEDFLSPMVVEGFVQWLFAKCTELGGASVEKAKEVGKVQRVLEPRHRKVFENTVRNVESDRMAMEDARNIISRKNEGESLKSFISRGRPTNGQSTGRGRSTSPQRRRSRSPRVVRYESINSRLSRGAFRDDDEIVDARQLLSKKRDVERTGRNERMDARRYDRTDTHQVRSKRTVKLVENDSVAPAEDNRLIKCTYWPNCKAGESCPFAHPSEPCKHFPNCSFGEKCIYIHPVIACKFQDRCQNSNCNYQHQSPAGQSGNAAFITTNNPYQPPSAIPCRFFPNCKNTNCPFLHPNTAVCKFGENCQRPACPFVHPNNRTLACKAFVNAPCRYGKNCTKLDCPFQHSASPVSPTAMQVGPNENQSNTIQTTASEPSQMTVT